MNMLQYSNLHEHCMVSRLSVAAMNSFVYVFWKIFLADICLILELLGYKVFRCSALVGYGQSFSKTLC